MNSNYVYLISLVILIAFSSFFSATETAFAFVNRTRQKLLAGDGDHRAILVLRLCDEYDRLITAVLIGNNIVNILSASIATIVFVAWLGDYGVTASTVVMTVVILIFGEISPKTMARCNPDSIARFSAPIMRVIIKVMSPLIFLFDRWQRLIQKLFTKGGNSGMTEKELMILVDEAQNDGGIGQNEGDLIRAAIEFNDLDASDIVTPRVDIVGAEDTATLTQVAELFRKSGFSRLPVFHKTIDTVVGVVHQKDMHESMLSGNDSLEGIIKNVLFTAESTRISDLLRQLQRSKMHMAIVVDEFGGTAGVVTLEDILEELVGDIWDEHDAFVQDITPIDGGVLINCAADLDDIFDYFKMNDDYDAVTVSGWVMQELGKIPVVGDSFKYKQLCVTVVKTELRRPLKIMVTVSPEVPVEKQ